MNALVSRAGFLTSVQDLGRTGFRQFGVSTSGALDPFALRVANLLVGNDEGAAGLEITLGGLHLRFGDERMVAWCGGEFDVQTGKALQLPAVVDIPSYPVKVVEGIIQVGMPKE